MWNGRPRTIYAIGADLGSGADRQNCAVQSSDFSAVSIDFHPISPLAPPVARSQHESDRLLAAFLTGRMPLESDRDYSAYDSASCDRPTSPALERSKIPFLMSRKKARQRSLPKGSHRKVTGTRSDSAADHGPAGRGTPASHPPQDPQGRPTSPSETPLPGQTLRTVLSLWLGFHLTAMAISFTSVVEPSSVHASLSDLVHPYLRPAHFSADDRPVYLTHGEPSEQPHQIQVTTDPVNGWESMDRASWQIAGPQGAPGGAVSDRVARWLATAAMLAENSQPSLAAELVLPLARRQPDVTAVRIKRFPTDLNDVHDEGDIPYVANVIRTDRGVTLVELQEPRLSSPAVLESEILSPQSEAIEP